MDPSQLAGQPLTLAAVLLIGFGGVIAAIKFGFGRVAKAFEGMEDAFKGMADKSASTEKTLVALQAEVHEGREDIREIRDVVADRLEPRRRTAPRPATNPIG